MLYYLLCLLSPSAKPFLTRMLHIGARGFLYEIRITLEGATSAHAKNTAIPVEFQGPIWNYLRVRGEYVPDWAVATPLVELPPRTRRILQQGIQPRPHSGTTSAHAENTSIQLAGAAQIRNYLRARGEYTPATSGIGEILELPPRTRRIPAWLLFGAPRCGTTSAHAEDTT